MNVKLVHDWLEADDFPQVQETAAQSDCDCDCACPVAGMPVPELSLPLAAYLELTPVCNNRCPGCGNLPMVGRADGPLDGGGWIALIERLAPVLQQVKLTGGEPTLHPAFKEIVTALAAQQLPFTLFTNGRWEDPEALLSLLSRAGNCDGLLISLHGPEAATHEAFSAVAGSFGETTENLRRAAAAGLPVAASMVLQPANGERIEATLELALRLGAHHLVCNRWIGTEPAGMALSAAQLRAAMATVERLRAAGAPIRFGNCIPQCFELSSSTGCTAGVTFFTVDAWGRVRPCNHAPESVGDLRTQSLAEIWKGAGLARWRAAIPAGCAGCGLVELCRGGCRAQAQLSGQAGDPLMGVPVGPVRPAEEPEVRLWSGLRPVGQFIQREDGAALVLIRRGQVTAAPEVLREVVPLLDGVWTLAAIQERCGQSAVNWIGELYRQGWVHWAK